MKIPNTNPFNALALVLLLIVTVFSFVYLASMFHPVISIIVVIILLAVCRIAVYGEI